MLAVQVQEELAWKLLEWERVQAGDYEGTRNIEGKEQPSIFREYADAVVEGLLEYYKGRK